jgi:hypothetical protein
MTSKNNHTRNCQNTDSKTHYSLAHPRTKNHAYNYRPDFPIPEPLFWLPICRRNLMRSLRKEFENKQPHNHQDCWLPEPNSCSRMYSLERQFHCKSLKAHKCKHRLGCTESRLGRPIQTRNCKPQTNRFEPTPQKAALQERRKTRAFFFF